MSRAAGFPAVSSLGLVTCIGRDVVTAAAAQRAGIVRRRPLVGVTAYDEGDLEAPVVGAPIADALEGFVQTGAWLRLAEGAVADLIRYGGLPTGDADPAFWGRTALSWILPRIDLERFGWPGEEIPALLDRWTGRALLDLARLPISRAPLFFPSGPAGLAAAIRGLSVAFADGADRVLLLATDSWLDTMSLAWLGDQGRLKTAENPIGLCPGQAGACALVENPRAAGADPGVRPRAGRAEAVVLGAAMRAVGRPSAGGRGEDGDGSRDETDDDGGLEAIRAAAAPRWGEGLAACVIEVLRSTGIVGPFAGDIYVDLSGESWQATAWGHALPRLHGALDLDRVQVRIPAVQTGDIGAASSLAALCFAVRSHARGYAPDRESLICSIGDDGNVAAIVVGSPR